MNRQTSNDLAELVHALGRRKTATARVKQAPTDGSGRFTAVVSTFGPPPDTQGDVVAPGAFLLSIADWRARGKMPAVWWQHMYDNPSASLGVIERMYEAEEGLVIEARLDLEHEPSQAVYEGMLSGRISEFSIGYAVLKEHPENGYNVLDEVELLEVSVVHAGANRFTRLVDVKSSQSHAVLDESTLDGELPDDADLVAQGWHIEERELEFAVVREDTGEAVAAFATREGAEVRLRALYRAAVAAYNRRLDALLDKSWTAPTTAEPVDVDAFVTQVREEVVREKLAEARASSFDGELNERAAHTGPVPEFDERFAVTSVPTEYESGDSEPEQVVGYESETFRIAVLAGTMRPYSE